MNRFLFFFLLSSQVYGQFNDTLFYASGMIKVVEVIEMEPNKIKYEYVNLKGDTARSEIGIFALNRFVCYDNEGVLEFSSTTDTPTLNYKNVPTRRPDSTDVSFHQFSVDMFNLPFLNLDLKYQYTFGKRMKSTILTRVAINNSVYFQTKLIQHSFGTGIKLNLVRKKDFVFAADIVPTIAFSSVDFSDPFFYLPLSLNFEFYITKNFGVSSDFGLGRFFPDDTDQFIPRAHIGLLWCLNKKKTIETYY